MWSGFSQIWWDNVAHDWRVWGVGDEAQGNDDNFFYDKPVNVFRAYLESIIAALSVNVPAIKCSPDDAQDDLDIQTSRAGDKIGKLIYKHNDAQLLFIHALYIYCTQGMIAAYNYTDCNEKYGTYQKPQYESSEEVELTKYCKNCGNEIGPADVQKSNEYSAMKEAEYDPDDDDAAVDSLLQDDGVLCPKCQQSLDTEVKAKKVIVTRFVGRSTAPKSRQKIEVYGGLFVKVPVYAKNIKKTPYIAKLEEEHYTFAMEEFPDLKDKIGPNSSSSYDPYERWARLNTQYLGDYPNNTVTRADWWLRPSTFCIIRDEKEAKQLKKEFPDGVKVTLINDQIACAVNEDLEDHWTLTENPLSSYVHFDPLGMLLTSIQEITNDILSLVLQTMEHGIAQTFADPTILNFEQYRQTEVRPGDIFPTKIHTGKAIKDGFYEVSTATLSPEIEPFSTRLESMGQFVSGALPSVFGGDQSNSSRTAAQYAMSRSQALQRLQTPWKMLITWWKNIFSKVIPAYIKNVEEDERYVERDVTGNYVNILIRKAELEGQIGDVEVESADQLPISWAQEQDMIIKLFQMNIPEITQALTSPENAYLLKEALGLPNFSVPGEGDRNKQYDEIQILINGETMHGPDGTEHSSVEPELLVDNHMIEAHILQSWLVGEAGRIAKIDKPKGYRNCLIHLQEHIQMGRQLTQSNQPPPKGPQQQSQLKKPTGQPQMPRPQVTGKPNGQAGQPTVA